MKRCAIYARVSTPEQRIDNQLYDLRKFAEQRGYEVSCEYTDVGISGAKARRPGLDSMLRDARKRKFGVVIVAAFDRVARSTKHFLSVVDELDSLGVEFVSRRENIATDGAMGRLFLTIISSIAELEGDLIRERIRAGMSLTNVGQKYSVSRASVVRFVRLARQRESGMLKPIQSEPREAIECAA